LQNKLTLFNKVKNNRVEARQQNHHPTTFVSFVTLRV
jgi:hypothetical protein